MAEHGNDNGDADDDDDYSVDDGMVVVVMMIMMMVMRWRRQSWRCCDGDYWLHYIAYLGK